MTLTVRSDYKVQTLIVTKRLHEFIRNPTFYLIRNKGLR